jgi:hypothetical protein
MQVLPLVGALEASRLLQSPVLSGNQLAARHRQPAGCRPRARADLA